MSAHIIKRGSSYDNIVSAVANLDYNYSILQSIIPLYSETLKGAFIHMGVKIRKVTDLKKQMVALDFEKRWCQDITK